MKDIIDNREELWHQSRVPESKLRRGSLTGKIPYQLDAKTVIYIDRNATPEEIARKIQKYLTPPNLHKGRWAKN